MPESFNGYTMIAPTTSDTVYLIDNCGYQVHKWATEGVPGFGTYLLENGDLLRTQKISNPIFFGGGSGGRVQKYSWDGDLLWNYQVSDSTIHQHHDVEPMPNGNVLVLSWGFVSNEEAILNGRNPSNLTDGLWPTTIQEIEPVYPDSGIVVWEWTVWDHLVQNFDSSEFNYGVIADHPELLDVNYSNISSPDFLHCNAIDFKPENDLIVMSSRWSSEIYVIDHSTTTAEAATHTGGNRGKGGDFLYRWGNPQIYDRGDSGDQILFGPHDIHWIPGSLDDRGKFMVFNNLGGSSGSAVNIFASPMLASGDFPDPGIEPFSPLDSDWTYEDPGFSSTTVSGAQRLPNGNTLICEGASGNVFELTPLPENKKVWQYVNPAAISGNYTQGINPIQNALFRAYRYAPDFPAFIGKNLIPGKLIEIDPDPAPCSLNTELQDTIAGNIINGDQTFCPLESIDLSLSGDHNLPAGMSFVWIIENTPDTLLSYEYDFGNDPSVYQFVGDFNGYLSSNGLPELTPGDWTFQGGIVSLVDSSLIVIDLTDIVIITVEEQCDLCLVFENAPVDLTKSFDPVNNVQDRVQVKWYKDSPQVKYSDEDAAMCDIRFWPKRNLDPITGNPIGAAIVDPDSINIVDVTKIYGDGSPREIFKWPVKFRADGVNNNKRAEPNIRYEWQVRCECGHDGSGPESPWSAVKIFNTPDFDPATGIYTPPPGVNRENLSKLNRTEKIELIPNPANELLQVWQADGLPENFDWYIMDMTGRVLMSEMIRSSKSEYLQIELHGLAQGSYQLMIVGSEINTAATFLISR